MSEINLGIQLMGYGLVGIFIVLIMFYFVIRLLVRVFPFKEGEEK